MTKICWYLISFHMGTNQSRNIFHSLDLYLFYDCWYHDQTVTFCPSQSASHWPWPHPTLTSLLIGVCWSAYGPGLFVSSVFGWSSITYHTHTVSPLPFLSHFHHSLDAEKGMHILFLYLQMNTNIHSLTMSVFIRYNTVVSITLDTEKVWPCPYLLGTLVITSNVLSYWQL